MAREIDTLENIIINDFGMYDMFPPNWLEEDASLALCTELPEVCEAFLELFADLDVNVDNLNRIKTYLSHFPSGAGYRNFVHYA